MGSLSEAINGYRGTRAVYNDSNPRYRPRLGHTVGGGNNSDYVQVSGIEQNQQIFEDLLTSDPGFDMNFRALIRKILKEARKNLSRDAANYIENDPRKAARAVKHTVYKRLFGGNLSILQKRRRGPLTQYVKPRTLQPGQRGGNRREISDRTFMIDHYGGADRGFVLRFLNAGTVSRQTRYGNRGSIRQTDWFGHTAPWEMQTAANDLANAVNEYIKQKANG